MAVEMATTANPSRITATEPGSCRYESATVGSKSCCTLKAKPTWTNCREVGRCVMGAWSGDEADPTDEEQEEEEG